MNIVGGYLIINVDVTTKIGLISVPNTAAVGTNTGVVVDCGNDSFLKKGDSVVFHRTEGDKLNGMLLLHNSSVYGYSR